MTEKCRPTDEAKYGTYHAVMAPDGSVFPVIWGCGLWLSPIHEGSRRPEDLSICGYRYSHPLDISNPNQAFQSRVWSWAFHCFGETVARNKQERTDRLFEEIAELCQTVDGWNRGRAHALVDYVFDRPVGEMRQEVGGSMLTLAAFCAAHDIDMGECAESELARVWTKVDVIRAKQAAKPTGSALPIAVGPQYGGNE